MRKYGEEIKQDCLDQIEAIKTGVNTGAYKANSAGVTDYDLVKRCNDAVKTSVHRIETLTDELTDLARILDMFYSYAETSLTNVKNKASETTVRVQNISDSMNSLASLISGVGEFKGMEFNSQNIKLACAPTKSFNLIVKSKHAKISNKKDWKEYIRFLESEFGLNGITDERASAFNIMLGNMKKRGYTDDMLYIIAPSILKDGRIDQINHIPGSEQAKFGESKSWFKDYYVQVFKGIVMARRRIVGVIGSTEDTYDSYPINGLDECFEILSSQLSTEDLRTLVFAMANPDKTFENVSMDERLEYFMRLTVGFRGYEGTWSGDLPLSFFGSYYAKDPNHWCAEFVVWAMTYSGLLNPGSSVLSYTDSNGKKVEVDYYNAIGYGGKLQNSIDYYWANQTNIKNSFTNAGKFVDIYSDRDALPHIGDLVICHGNNHVAVVAGVDVEKKIVYTIEGNNANSVKFSSYDLNEERERPAGTNSDITRTTRNVIGFCEMGGTRQDMKIIDEYCNSNNYFSMDWNFHEWDGYGQDKENITAWVGSEAADYLETHQHDVDKPY